ncbi:MAG: sulfatase [Eubacteriales bacterium]
MKTTAKKRPNFLFILSDDHGAWAMGCAGNKELKTPNLDRLADMGVRFNNFFCASPVCSPARASIMCGKIPSAHGVHDWLAKGNLSDEKIDKNLLAEYEKEDLPWYYAWGKSQITGDSPVQYLAPHRTITGELAKTGYECALSGKWHIGDSATPQAGCTYWKTLALGGDNYFYPMMLVDGKIKMIENEYVTDVITANALEFLNERDREKPFFLSVNYTAPHSPWSAVHHKKEYIDMYRECPFETTPNLPPHQWTRFGSITLEEWNSRPHTGIRYSQMNYPPIPETWQEHRRESLTGYYAAISAMDESIGRIIDRLEADGLLENTVIVFTADNGMNMGHHGIWGKGNGTCPVNMYDTSVKVPAIIAAPGRFEGHRVSDEMLSHYDLFPTLLDIADVEIDPDPEQPGASFKNLLEGKPERVRENVVVYDEYGPCRMIRNKDYKLVLRYPGPCELYDLNADPDEYDNLYDNPDYKALIAEMTADLDNWFEKYANPEFDGKREAVTGGGQRGRHSFGVKV